MAKDNYTIEDEIQHRMLTGDAYPAYMDYLRRAARGGVGPGSSSNGYVNVSVGVGAIEGEKPLIGMVIYVVCPGKEEALMFVPEFSALLRKYKFTDTANGIDKQLAVAVRREGTDDDRFTLKSFWPKGAGPLR